MSERRIDAFFYGLFMDPAILRAGGVAEPANPRHAFVDDFEVRIGQRATLVPRAGARAYGMLFALTHTELDPLSRLRPASLTLVAGRRRLPAGLGSISDQMI